MSRSKPFIGLNIFSKYPKVWIINIFHNTNIV
jgi:hypothetical protein